MSGYLKKILKRNKKPVLADQPKPESKQNSSRSIFSKKSDEIFRNTFPLLSIIVDKIESNNKDDAKDRTQQSIFREDSIRKSDAIATKLASLTIEQGKSVTLLKELLGIVKDLNSDEDAKPADTSGVLGGLGSKLAAGAAAATLGGAALALYNTQNNEANRRDQPAEQGNEPAAAATPTTNQPAVTRETQERTVANFSLARFRENDPEGAREYEAKLNDRRKELIEESIRRTPAYQSGSPATQSLYMQGFESSAESRARAELLPQYAERITAARAGTVQHVQTSNASSLSTAPAVSLSSVPAEQNTTQTPRISSGTQPRITRPPASTQQSVSTPASQSGTAPSEGSSTRTDSPTNATGTGSRLNFAPGVDPRINDNIAQKVERISSTAPDMVVTSGYRDPQRNAAAGGARNSAHLSGNAVDIQFRGNEQDTIKVIEAASAAGIGGIGVYRPGWLHLDTESRRVWGPDFTDRSIPEWAKPSLQAHASGQRPNQAVAQQVESEPSTPSLSVEGSTTPAATPAASAPTTGAAVATASQANAVAERTPAPPSITTSEVAAAGQASPGVATPGTFSSPTEPGNVEPADSAERYARLFNMAA